MIALPEQKLNSSIFPDRWRAKIYYHPPIEL